MSRHRARGVSGTAAGPVRTGRRRSRTGLGRGVLPALGDWAVITALVAALVVTIGLTRRPGPRGDGPGAGRDAGTAATTTVTYRAATGAVANPERGFYVDVDMLADSDLSWVRQQGSTVARGVVDLSRYQDRPLDAAVLDRLGRRFADVRRAGIKVILRFAYSFADDGRPAPGPRLDLALRHVRQLAPVLRRDVDVISSMEAGFVGTWGGWGSAAGDLGAPEGKRRILDALLEALPRTRMVAVPDPAALPGLYRQPLPAAQASTGSAAARTGFHPFCWLADSASAPQTDRVLRGYLTAVAPYVPVGGETCDETATGPRAGCPTALAEFRRFRWTYLNDQYSRKALARWRSQGCLDDIDLRLGYRLRLVSAALPTSVAAGARLRARLLVANDGWAAPLNPRSVRLVLRSTATRQVVALATGVDVRRWHPGPARSVALDLPVPADLPVGRYDVLLHLADPEPALTNRPAYAIRLADVGLWDGTTGYNSLRHRLEVLPRR